MLNLSRGTITDMSEEDLEPVMAVNVSGYFHMAKAAIARLVKTKGRSFIGRPGTPFLVEW